MLYLCKYQSLLDNNFNEVKFIAKTDNEAIKRTKENEFYFFKRVKEVTKLINDRNKITIFINPDFKQING